MTTKEKIIEAIGYLAAILGTFLMLPQVIKSVQTESVGDVSFVMLWVYAIQCLLWLVYGIGIKKVPLVLCNGIALIIGIVQLYLKFTFG